MPGRVQSRPRRLQPAHAWFAQHVSTDRRAGPVACAREHTACPGSRRSRPGHDSPRGADGGVHGGVFPAAAAREKDTSSERHGHPGGSCLLKPRASPV